MDHVVRNMPEDQKKILIIYDIACLTKKRMEVSTSKIEGNSSLILFFKAEIPMLRGLDPQYVLTAFHAYAHALSCQVTFNPKYLEVGKLVRWRNDFF